MTHAKLLGLGALAIACLIGCGEPAQKPSTKVVKSDHDDHDHVHGKGPHGGVVFDFGKHHAEFTVNHDKKECKILILGADETTPTPIDAKELTLTTKETKTKNGEAVPAMTIKLLPIDEKDGKATTYAGTDPGLGHEVDFEGTLIGEVGGKPAEGEFKE